MYMFRTTIITWFIVDADDSSKIIITYTLIVTNLAIVILIFELKDPTNMPLGRNFECLFN